MDSLHDPQDGLSPAAKAALAALQAEDDMPADARARVWERLDAAVPRDRRGGAGRRFGAGLVIGLALAAGVVLAVAGIRGSAVSVATQGAVPAAQYGGETAGMQATQRREGVEANAGSAGAAATNGGSEAAGVENGAGAGAGNAGTNVVAGNGAGASAENGAGASAGNAGTNGVAGNGAGASAGNAGTNGVAGNGAGASAGNAGTNGAGSAAGVSGERAAGADPADRSSRTGRKRAGETVEEAARGPALGREAALLQQAQAALAGARASEALAHLASYEREFGADGVLRPEHDGLRAVALCAAGRAAEGRAAADRFLAAYAGSVQAERVRGACADGR